MITIYVPDIPEFEPFLRAARMAEGCKVHDPVRGYWRVDGATKLTFIRKEMGLGPALWNSALTGGFRGRITEYGRDRLVIEDEE